MFLVLWNWGVTALGLPSWQVEMKTASGLPFVCEIQVTLSGITILKKSEQLVYTLMRMESPQELCETCVFSQAPNEHASPTCPAPLRRSRTCPAVPPDPRNLRARVHYQRAGVCSWSA